MRVLYAGSRHAGKRPPSVRRDAGVAAAQRCRREDGHDGRPSPRRYKEFCSTMASHSVDALVIGAGPGGYHVAIRLGQLGKSVICVDRDEVGGVCLNWGCIPTKALLHVGEVVRHIEHANAIGLKVAKPEVDREGVAKFKTDVVNSNVAGVKTLFKANNVQFIYGEASLKNANQIVVKNKEGGQDTITAQNIVIATGSAPIDV